MAIDLGNNPVGTPPTTEEKAQIRSALDIGSAALKDESFFATSAALNGKADKVSPSLGLKNLNDSDLLDTIVSVNGTYLQGTSLNWPDVNYSDSTPVWWNVQTFGESNRITQIAHYGFSVNDTTKRIFWRMKHDADWSEWRQVALISDISGGGVAWGNITGVLSSQTDLQSALNNKADSSISISGTGMIAGGGNLTVDRTLNLAATAAFTVLMNNTSASAVPTAVTMASLKTALALTKADIGLGNVDNTSDINKPISTATQTALNEKGAIINWSTLSGTTPALVFADGPKAHTLTLSGNTTFSASGYAQGRAVELFLTGHASNSHTLDWPDNWKWLEGEPANLAATKSMRISLICTGGSDSTVFAIYAVQS